MKKSNLKSVSKLLLICALIIGNSVYLSAQSETDSLTIKKQEGKKVHFVAFPSYDYRPVLEHSIALLGKGIFTLKNNSMLVSSLTGVKSLNNPSYLIQFNNDYYLSKWRFNLNVITARQVNKMAASEIGMPVPGQFTIDNFVGSYQLLAKRKLSEGLYIGFGYEIVDVTTDLELSGLGVPGVEDVEMKTFLSQPEIIAEFDSRDDVVYPTNGFYVTAQSNLISDAFGSKIENLGATGIVEEEDFFYTRNFIKASYFRSLSGDWRSVLASRVQIRAATGDIPVGLWENVNSYIRGYTEGNFTGKQLYHLDVEWRKYLTDRFGFVAFGTAGFVGEDIGHAFSSDRFVPSGGLGLRVQVLKSKKVAFRIDHAWGRDGESSIYFGLSEYF